MLIVGLGLTIFSTDQLGGLIVAGVAVAWLLTLALKYLLVPGARKQKSLGGERSFEFGEEVKSRTPYASTTMKWEGFDKAVETEDFYLLYASKAVALILPKRVFSTEQEILFRDLVSRKVHGTNLEL